MAKQLLMIDDEQMILEAFSLVFEDLGYTVVTCADPAKGVEAALAAEYDLIMVDLRMPGMNGAEVARRIVKGRPEARILVVTGVPADPLAAEALEAGAFALLKKPFEVTKVLHFLGKGT